MIEITCIRKSNGYHENRHIAISSLRWVNTSTGDTGESTRIQMYDWVLAGNRAFVKDKQGDKAYLMCAITKLGTKYVKTVPDETKADNLLMLPECR
jgi:hypothetical protein